VVFERRTVEDPLDLVRLDTLTRSATFRASSNPAALIEMSILEPDGLYFSAWR
jgi:hypothetical protein